ncbi:hypothetical protein [Fibrella forsythiae]|uniref:DNA-binding protein n=1 Tax=Fibrella forsythiae TaxID=2817061 RepID=A0ABS3JT46_9BACT|nr:hypothetical protein [Fibrella forsythiae]MBO0953170.1 hypothetical protein [Fibrella forsythiae]
MLTVDELIEQIHRLTTDKQIPAVQAQVDAFLKTTPLEADVTRLKETLGKKLIKLGEQARAESRDSLYLNGVHYFLGDWLTPSQYSKRFDIRNLSTIYSWIRSGTIPASNILYVEQLGIRLIKAVDYRYT